MFDLLNYLVVHIYASRRSNLCSSFDGPFQPEVTWYEIQTIGEQKNMTRLYWEM